MRFLICICLLFSTILSISQSNFYEQLADSAMSIEDASIIYDPAYFSIDYPNGDVPSDRGVCTDVIIRTYRKFGIDLQKEVHEDMLAHFDVYPDIWGLSTPDKNIDHRRVPNLMKFFERKGKVKPITNDAGDYFPGDIVCWDLGGGITHIGIVLSQLSRDQKRHLIMHNIGGGQIAEDILFRFMIIGHYTYK